MSLGSRYPEQFKGEETDEMLHHDQRSELTLQQRSYFADQAIYALSKKNVGMESIEQYNVLFDYAGKITLKRYKYLLSLLYSRQHNKLSEELAPYILTHTQPYE